MQDMYQRIAVRQYWIPLFDVTRKQTTLLRSPPNQYTFLVTFFFCLFVFFHSCCSHAQAFGKTLVHEFPISYTPTEWHFIFSRNDMIEMVEESPIKN